MILKLFKIKHITHKARIIAFLLAAIFISAHHAGAQTWCPKGAEWTYNFYSMALSGYQKLVYEKDTIISSQPCKKIVGNLIIPHYDTWDSPPTGVDTIPVNPVFTFSQGDTVFMFSNNSFQPVYYFNAQVGDTLPYYNIMLPNFTGCDTILRQVVDDAGTISINNETLRFYIARFIDFDDYFFSPETVAVIERLGATNNFLIPEFYCFTDAETYTLRCYGDDNFETYQTKSTTACDYIYTGLTDLEKSTITISPNPTLNILNISSSYNTSIEHINIYNIVGQLQKRMSTGSGQTILTIDVSKFLSGIYFIQLVTRNGQVMTTKFIKQTP